MSLIQSPPPATHEQPKPRLLIKDLIVQLYVPVGVRTLEKWITTVEFPRLDLRHGAKLLFWRRDTVEEWFDKYVKEHSA